MDGCTNGAGGLDDGGPADGGVAVTMDLLRRALTASLEQELFNRAVVLTLLVSFLRT